MASEVLSAMPALSARPLPAPCHPQPVLLPPTPCHPPAPLAAGEAERAAALQVAEARCAAVARLLDEVQELQGQAEEVRGSSGGGCECGRRLESSLMQSVWDAVLYASCAMSRCLSCYCCMSSARNCCTLLRSRPDAGRLGR